MTKYDSAKYLTRLKAKILHKCYKCGVIIEAGEYYYKEKLDMRPPPNIVLREYCERCGDELSS